MVCRVCGNPVLHFQNIRHARAEGGSLSRKEPFVVKTQSIEMLYCPKCGHIQIPYLLDANYYTSYDEVSGFQQYVSELNKIEEKIAKLKEFSHKNGNLLEIGSGAGYALKIANKYFEETIGVDPSEKECEIAQKSGLAVICGSFDEKIKFDKKMVAISTFQTLEHMENLRETVQCMYNILEKNGVGIINVPNGEQIIKNNLYHQILLEHINYFTPQSLITLVESVGFEVIDLVLDRETIEMDLYIRKTSNKCLEDAYEKMKITLNDILERYETIGVYGAGAKSAFYSSLINKDNKIKIYRVFDSNEEKKNTYLSGINSKVELVKTDALNACDVIIIFASSYNREIVLKLKEMGYCGNIIIFEQSNVKLLIYGSY